MQNEPDKFLARTDGHGHQQKLENHLRGVADLAAGFSNVFSSSGWGRLAGLWHDIGKYQLSFQEKLLGKRLSVDHSAAGATLAVQKFGDLGLPIAFAIAGHHAGLANWLKSEAGLPSPLKERLTKSEGILSDIEAHLPADIVTAKVPALPTRLIGRNIGAANQRNRSTDFWIRFLFSALVDADRLDAEKFENPELHQLRSGYSTTVDLNHLLDQYLEHKIDNPAMGTSNSAVNLIRRQVLKACQESATSAPGIFSLTVPTGGGKTLSAMSFALRHAVVHDLRRIIVVIPYTSIIEQNAAVYCEALGADNIIEHHSSYDPTRNTSTDMDRYELATENWDAPVIITTSVQFFETLFSSRPSVCRKLHNVAKSVIIFDEVQTLPPGLLLAILEGINELTTNYGCSIVLSTATPPALAARPGFDAGLKNVQNIIPHPEHLVTLLKRVRYAWPEPGAQVLWPELAAELAKEKQVLAIVDRRKDARELAQELQKVSENPVYHLSALMCPAHRLDVINRIKECLKQGVVCRVVSTQLVEAGVDLDFPVVYRSLTGLASIIQAAGRCNREGHLTKGKVIVFRSPSPPPAGTLKSAKDITESMLREAGTLDPDDLSTVETFFRQLYFTQELDALGIQTERQEFNFATVGQKFRLIEDGFTRDVVVPFDDSTARLEKLRKYGADRQILRSLQPYSVSIYPDAFKKLNDSGALVEVDEIFALSPTHHHLYDPVFGLVVGDEPPPILMV